MEEDSLGVGIDQVLGLGRVGLLVKLAGNEQMIALPQLHFILYHDVDPDKNPAITGICLEFALLYSSKNESKDKLDPRNTFHGLRSVCEFYVNGIAETKKTPEDFEKTILKVIKETKVEELWDIYRTVNFRTALRDKPIVDWVKLARIVELEGDNAVLREKIKELEGNREKESVSTTNIPTVVASKMSLEEVA